MISPQRCLALVGSLALIGTVRDASAFSLLGPFDGYQGTDLNYQRTIGRLPLRSPRIDDVGGPQNLGEEYRRNLGAFFYAYNYAFLDYFGAKGADEVDKAVKVLNDLPAFSSMSEDLSEFPLETQRINYRASALGLVDLKSYTLGTLVEQMGLLSGVQYAWTLRQKQGFNNLPCPYYDFWIIRRNFDPVTWEPTSYINGALYTFSIEYVCAPEDVEDAAEVAVDPLASNWSPVVENEGYVPGGYYTGLTRDDVGGLRYLYRKSNFNYEPLPNNVFAGATSGGSAWSPVNPNVTNTPLTGISATFGGIDKLRFVKVYFDGLLGQTFTTVSNNYTLQVAVNVQTGANIDGGGGLNLQVQDVQVTRVATFPDIIFSAGDVLDGSLPPFVHVDRTPPTYVRSADYAVNNGPGIIDNTVTFTFNKQGPYLQGELNPLQPYVNESTSFQAPRYAAFDGTTNPPVIFPSGVSIKEMERVLLGGN